MPPALNLPATFNPRSAGCCITAARLLAGQCVSQSLSAQVIEGWIQFEDEDGSTPEDLRFAHTWLEVDDEIVDPALEQFWEYLDWYPYSREVLATEPAAAYLADTRSNTKNPALFFTDGRIPADCLPFLVR